MADVGVDASIELRALSSTIDCGTTIDACVIDDARNLSSCVSALASASPRVIAIDIEAAGPLACTLQLSAPNTRDYVLDLLALGAAPVRDALSPLLSDSRVLKLLHGAASDCVWLSSLSIFLAPPVLDTQLLAMHLGEPPSLGSLVTRHCSMTLQEALVDKARLQRSDWRVRPLDAGAILYAAADARCLILLTASLVRSAGLTTDAVFMPTLLDLALRRSTALVLRHSRVRHTEPSMSVNGGSSAVPTSFPGPSPSSTRDAMKQARASRVFMPRKTPLYSNCLLLAQDGTPMARIDIAKARWYLQHGIAEVADSNATAGEKEHRSVCEHSVTRAEGGGGDAPAPGTAGGPLLRIRMLHAPRGLGHAGEGDSGFHLAPRSNHCVVCGATWAGTNGQLVRNYIVPRAFKRHLPLAAKSYSSIDVVLCCTSCHRSADVAVGTLLRRMAREFGVSLRARVEEDTSIIADIHTWRRSAVALLRCCSAPSVTLPSARVTLLVLSLAQAPIVQSLERLMAVPTPLPEDASSARVEARPRRGRAARTAAAAVAAADGTDPDFVRAWQEVVLPLSSPEARAAVEATGLCSRHILFLCHRALSVAAGVPQDDHEAVVAAQGAGEEDDAVTELMRHIYEGGHRWSRACGHFQSFSESGLDMLHVDTSGTPLVGVTGLNLSTELRLEALVRRFRATFLNVVKPIAMPEGWSVSLRVHQVGSRADKTEPTLMLEALAHDRAARCGGVQVGV